jgi:hypothetical protein
MNDHRWIAENMLHDADRHISGTTPTPQWQSITAHALLAVCDRIEELACIVAAVHLPCEDEEED